jgi:hypothetical protein
LLGLVVLASFVGAVVESSGPHTDDGCQVELHCRVCNWSYASTGMVALPVALGSVLVASHYLPPLRQGQPSDPRFFDLVPRGPPRS